MKLQKKSAAALFRAAAATIASIGISNRAALGGTSTNTAGPVLQGQSDAGTGNPLLNNPAVTISFSGQTALRSFNTSQAITELQPGTSIVLHNGTGGAAVTYYAPNDPDTNVQLASPNFTSADYWEDEYTDPLPIETAEETAAAIQVNSGIRLEWHEQGSIDGFYDLINDEVGYAQNASQALANNSTAGPISNEALRTPSSSNPTWINTNKFTTGATTAGLTLDNSANDILDQTYNTNVYTPATGVNILGGQNRIQFAVGEYPTEAVSVPGTPNPYATAGSAGYGQGNPALASGAQLTALGTAGLRQQFQPATILNESSAIDDPQTGGTYAAGPWNTAGTNNITSTPIAATAVTYSANPGTGLYRIDLGDAQWLQTTGRLQNGALFDVVARTVDTGQRAVFALNTGIDPSWAVGSNDDGNSTSTTNANLQHTIGAAFRLDGKTSGTEAEKTIAQGRMALGALSVPEARAAASNAPVRALDVDFTDQTDVNPSDDSTNFIRADFNTIVSSNAATRYQAVLISHYNSVKSPNETALDNELEALDIDPASATTAQQATAWALVNSFNPTNLSDPTTSGIKGDTTGDVASFIANIANSVAVAATQVNAPTSADDPADGLLSIGFLLPDLLDWTRVTDGGPITPVTLSSTAQTEQTNAYNNYGPLFGTDSSAAANLNTIGTGSTYADGNSTGPAVNTAIPITAKNVTWTNGTVTAVSGASNGAIVAGGNYLFGNFNQTGVRDFSAVQESVDAALSLYAVDSNYHGTAGVNGIYTGAPNNTVIPALVGNPGWQQTGTNTKGDLIAMGDYLGQGTFNGEDLYLLATGAALADNTTSGTLTATAATFSDAIRNPNIVLRKNAALTYISNYLATTTDTLGAAFLNTTARAVITDPNVLTAGQVPFGAVPIGTDPVSGYEQFTYDPNGVNAFNPADVLRAGTVDFNDAVIVDKFDGQSYQTLTQSLSATAQAPVSGITEAISLVAVQQIDGEAAIGTADLNAINTALAATNNANWYDFDLMKTGPGTIVWARTAGTVTVYTGATLELANGKVNVGGTVDPFTDNNAPGPGSTAGNHVNLIVDHGSTLAFTNVGGTNTVSSLVVNSGGVVDIGKNKLVIDYGASADPAAAIDADLKSGAAFRASGNNYNSWNGTGIVSSAIAPVASSNMYNVGYLDGNNAADNRYGDVAPNQILVEYTVQGNAFLESSVGNRDLQVVAADYGTGSGEDWSQGSFDYSGSVGNIDLQAVAAHYGSLSPENFGSAPSNVLQLAWDSADQSSPQVFGQPSVVGVPEPGSLALAAAGAGALLARRRRRT